VKLPTVEALVRLGEALRGESYSFVTTTPETHRRVLMRGGPRKGALAAAFGWSLPFAYDELPPHVADAVREGELAEAGASGLVSRVRFSTLLGGLYAHSAYPTEATDAVFFGPDTYRFCRAIRDRARRRRLVVDIGCGSGAGGIVAGRDADRVILADINERALLFARANARLNGVDHAAVVSSDVLAGVHGTPDLVVANPPYLRDALGRTYRDGGGSFGEGLALRIVEESLARLAAGGTLLLYTGAAIVDGVDTFFEAAAPILSRAKADVRYEEIDPDVFGEELALAPYAAVDRIAAVLLEVTSAGGT
jgi:methylase of polypeptide subunit release factors